MEYFTTTDTTEGGNPFTASIAPLRDTSSDLSHAKAQRDKILMDFRRVRRAVVVKN